MPHHVCGASNTYSRYALLNQDGKKAVIQWLDGLDKWTHALTLTMSRSKHELPPGRDESLRRCRLLLNRVNRVCYGRHGTRRKGFRVASVAFMGYGVYGDHPHIHWALAGPPDIKADEFTALLRSMVMTTKGLGTQFDIQDYYEVGWFEYMLDHGIEGFVEQLTFTAKCPVQ